MSSSRGPGSVTEDRPGDDSDEDVKALTLKLQMEELDCLRLKYEVSAKARDVTKTRIEMAMRKEEARIASKGIHTCTHTLTCIASIHTHMNLGTHAHTLTLISTFTHLYISYTSSDTRTLTHTHTHTHTHTCTHTHTHTHTHLCRSGT
jgi:hypothetical protein